MLLISSMHEIVNMLKTNLKIRSYNAAVHGALLSVMACHCFEIPSVSTFFFGVKACWARCPILELNTCTIYDVTGRGVGISLQE